MNIQRAIEIEYQSSERILELHWLASEAKQRRNIVEIGSLRGTSARAMADNTEGLITCVDSWDDWNIYQQFIVNTRDLKNVVSVRKRSLDAAELLKDQRFDMIFIDADHNYDYVRADILAWRPLLSPGGLFCGHDRQMEGVEQALKELIPDYQHAVGAIWRAP